MSPFKWSQQSLQHSYSYTHSGCTLPVWACTLSQAFMKEVREDFSVLTATYVQAYNAASSWVDPATLSQVRSRIRSVKNSASLLPSTPLAPTLISCDTFTTRCTSPGYSLETSEAAASVRMSGCCQGCGYPSDRSRCEPERGGETCDSYLPLALMLDCCFLQTVERDKNETERGPEHSCRINPKGS